MIFFRNATTQSESSFWMEEISILAKNNRTPGILGHRVREVGEVQKCGVTPKITFFIFLGLWWVLYIDSCHRERRNPGWGHTLRMPVVPLV